MAVFEGRLLQSLPKLYFLRASSPQARAIARLEGNSSLTSEREKPLLQIFAAAGQSLEFGWCHLSSFVFRTGLPLLHIRCFLRS